MARKDTIKSLMSDLEKDAAELKPQYDEYMEVQAQLKQLNRVLNPPPKRPRKKKGETDTATPATETATVAQA